MATVLTDTDCAIDYLSGRAPSQGAIWRARRGQEFAISSVSVYELVFGAPEGDARDELLSFLQGCTVVPLRRTAAEIAGTRGARLAAAGNKLDVADLLVAGTALDLGIPLITRNVRHFARIEELTLLEPA